MSDFRHRAQRPACVRGFSLVELLVTLAVLSLLAALLLPGLANATERTRRTRCRTNQKQFLLALHLYGNDHDGRLFYAGSDNPDPHDEHTPIIGTTNRQYFLRYAGDPRILICPGLRKPFHPVNGMFDDDYGFVMGYHYLGAKDGTPWPKLASANSEWRSPANFNGDPLQTLVADINSWCSVMDQTYAPHGPRGPIMSKGHSGNHGSGAVPSEAIGAQGGNIGRIDGSAEWRPIRLMKTYRCSRLWGPDGGFGSW